MNIYGLASYKRQHDGLLQLSSGRSTIWQELPINNNNVNTFIQGLYQPRLISSLDSLGNNRSIVINNNNNNNNINYNNNNNPEEVDLVAIVLYSTPVQRGIGKQGRPYHNQELYITDKSETLGIILLRNHDEEYIERLLAGI